MRFIIIRDPISKNIVVYPSINKTGYRTPEIKNTHKCFVIEMFNNEIFCDNDLRSVIRYLKEACNNSSHLGITKSEILILIDRINDTINNNYPTIQLRSTLS